MVTSQVSRYLVGFADYETTIYFIVHAVARSGQFMIEIDVKSRENKEVDEHSKIQCFQTPHTL